MRWRSAAKLSIYLAAVVSTSASGSQIQTFKNAPARPATAAQQIAKEQQQQQSEARLDTPEARTEKALNEARGHFGALYALLKEMPKGGDLHNHLTGAVYAESLILFAADSGLCIDRQSLALAQPPCQPNQAEARQALSDPELYRNAIDAWSMRGIKLKPESNGHDHFFDSFSKFSPATEGHLAQMLAEVSQRAADGNVQYLELMVAPDHGRAAALGAKLSYDPDFAAMRHKLLDADFGSAVEEARKNLDAMERGRNEELRCASEPEVQAGACSVHARYIYPVARAAKASQVFAQMLMGFELASRDPRFVAVNLIQPEDGYVPMHDFRLHMQMVSFLKSVYPNVHITLHAGELAPGLVPPDGLRFHIRESIEVGKAERIGHGVDVMYEENPHELLAMMARRNILVEICLSSNEETLGVRGRQHPLAMYLKAGVPVALATDDEGVSRSEMTREYERAVVDQGVDYATLKKMARASLEHSFLPGASLWSDAHKFTPVRECASERPPMMPNPVCMKFLNGSEKAREQWRLEHRFVDFESKF